MILNVLKYIVNLQEWLQYVLFLKKKTGIFLPQKKKEPNNTILLNIVLEALT